MRQFFSGVLAFCVLVSCGAARAAVETYDLDKPHTQIIFSVEHLGFSKSYGKFLDYTGSFVFDRGNPADSSTEVSIKVPSLDMGDAKWNEHLLGSDFFDAEKFPEMAFKSTKIEVTGEKTAKITGDLTLHGVTKPVTLDATFNTAGKRAFSDKYAAGFSAHATINRSDFGISYGLPMVGDAVDIIIEVEGNRREANASGGTFNK